MNPLAPHLGDRVTSLADGELGHRARDRALAHAAGCPQCRADLEAERVVRARLQMLADPRPAPDLTSRLLAIAAPDAPAPAPEVRAPEAPAPKALLDRPVSRRPRRPAARPASRPATPSPARRPPRVSRRAARVTLTGVASLALVLLGAVVMISVGAGSGPARPGVGPAPAASVGSTSTGPSVMSATLVERATSHFNPADALWLAPEAQPAVIAPVMVRPGR